MTYFSLDKHTNNMLVARTKENEEMRMRVRNEGSKNHRKEVFYTHSKASSP